jgi:DNA helicase-2/ATP-dependent DNA helicase PcrA
MYVAITRAAKRCFILYTKSRYRFGKTVYPQKSRFISEIDSQYLEQGNSFIERNRLEPKHISTPKYSSRQVSNPNPSLHKLVKPSIGLGAMASDDATRVRVGNIIEHSHFGVGEVVELLDAPSGRQMKVNFKSHGVKLMILKFVKFKILS